MRPKVLIDIKNIENKIDKISIVDDLITGGSDKVSSAETVKVLNANMEQKADKDKIISASNKIYQIGEIQNYIVTTTFELNCFLSGFYLDGNDNNAFTSGVLSIAKRNAVSVSTIKGTLNILQINNATSPYKCKIQITDKGKIYTISDSYMNFARLMVLTKTDNIVIYNSPILSSIDGNVIWDSELNEANIATNIDLEQKADKQWMVDGWKTETALPNDYPDGTTYFNSGSSAFNALGYVVIKTVKKTGMVKQTIFRDYATAKGEYVRYNKTYDNKSPDYNKWTPWEKIATTDKLDTLWSGNVSLSTTPQTITVSQDLTNYNYLLISHGSGVSTSGGVSEGTSAGEFILRPLNIEDFANGVNMYTYIHGVKVVLQRISATTISIWSSANLSLFRRIKGVKIGG